MITHNLKQGSPEWHAHRATHFNASDAPAMMGCSPYKTRTQLLHEKHTGLTPEVDAATQRRFDDGHCFEALARPLAEAIIKDELFPVVGTSGKLSASFDGLTMDDATAFEHKSLNSELRALLLDDCLGSELPLQYRVQMEQQGMVSGASRVLFMASKWDGDQLVEERHCWYTPDADLLAAIGAGWNQFEIDLAAYVPLVIAEMPKAEVTLALPALFIHAKGEITTSNMKEYGAALAARLESVRKIALITDQDFSNAKESAKLLRENIEQAKLAKDAMLAQTVTVGEAARMIDVWCEDMRLTALQLEKDVEREDKAKKASMVMATKAKYGEHLEALEKEISPARLSVPVPVFADALKNKRSFVSMQESLDTMLANAKIAADGSARAIRASLDCINTDGAGFEFLFSDKLALIGKPLDDLKLLVRTRISDHQAAELKKEEATRVRIQAEEKEKAEAAARLLVAQEAADAAKAHDAAQATLLANLAAAAAPTPVLSDKREADQNANDWLDALDAKAAANVVPLRAAPAPAAQTVESVWQTSQVLPEIPMQWIEVQEVNLYRFLPYKQNSTEFKRGKKGRWQRHTGYGFDNAEPQAGPWRVAEETGNTDPQAA